MRTLNILSISFLVAALLSACGENNIDDAEQLGANPTLPEAQRGLLPTLKIAEPAGWGDNRPIVPSGYKITAIATDLKIPRQTLVLPNGDILIAEGKGGGAPKLRPKDIIATYFKAKGTTSVKGGNRLTLLRDSNGDGTYETRTVFAENLNAPYGLALVADQLYVANQDAVVQFDYKPGQTTASGPPRKLTDLPSVVNHHWTKAMTASPDGQFLYVGIGSNSNITENGLDVEADRAMVWEIDAKSGAHRPYATGLRNPTALAILPGTNQLWAVINERDELGPRLVPDYLTSVQDGKFYGWPYSYWGQNVDPRVKPEQPDMVAAAIAPDYSLGSHKAPLGISFSTATMGGKFSEGAFIGEHGSWNRSDPAGYDVVFVPFSNGKPAGDPINFVTGFQGENGKTFGRPVGVTVDPKGALIVADDLSNTIWRVTPTR
ncbi:PQQ-dependent sugar dehydrogenase [Psychrobacter sp. SWN149]|uniref:PQQ-dependent sugar dehydrogenase n=1 Tax=Psychrobacter sp. SWN149 TaxID=2792057 RepID=UPI0018CF9778|nr:sorbosone dehydrogenase family protein [Psychrobacter sp. SWN149]MBH0007107.1 sorbosone dehydrogenase family protein [Psychrobacter sp. SWN149]